MWVCSVFRLGQTIKDSGCSGSHRILMLLYPLFKISLIRQQPYYFHLWKFCPSFRWLYLSGPVISRLHQKSPMTTFSVSTYYPAWGHLLEQLLTRYSVEWFLTRSAESGSGSNWWMPELWKNHPQSKQIFCCFSHNLSWKFWKTRVFPIFVICWADFNDDCHWAQDSVLTGKTPPPRHNGSSRAGDPCLPWLMVHPPSFLHVYIEYR